MRSCMEVKGCPPYHSERLAVNLVEADIRGHFSHGLNRLAMYVRDIQSGNCVPSVSTSLSNYPMLRRFFKFLLSLLDCSRNC